MLRLYQSSGSTTTRFAYDGGNIIAEYNSSNVLQARHVFGPGADEALVSYDAGGTRSWLIADERGSIIASTDASGAASAIRSYDEYGIPSGGNVGRFGYTGQAWLPELGMAYYKARMYSPTLGRFLQTDPIGYGDGMNIYAYVGNDPINMTDPSGLGGEAEQAKCGLPGVECPPPGQDGPDIPVDGHRPKDPLPPAPPPPVLPPETPFNPKVGIIVTAPKKPQKTPSKYCYAVFQIGEALEGMGSSGQKLAGIAAAIGLVNIADPAGVPTLLGAGTAFSISSALRTVGNTLMSLGGGSSESSNQMASLLQNRYSGGSSKSFGNIMNQIMKNNKMTQKDSDCAF